VVFIVFHFMMKMLISSFIIITPDAVSSDWRILCYRIKYIIIIKYTKIDTVGIKFAYTQGVISEPVNRKTTDNTMAKQ
jgi:hypothetical protein